MQNPRVRFEVLFAAGWLLFGALVLPAMVYVVGQTLFGPYEDGLGRFYVDLYSDAVAGSGRALGLVLGPYVIMLLARAPFIGFGKSQEEHPGKDEAPPAKKAAAPRSARVEPRVGPE
jgi:hypothetical protein